MRHASQLCRGLAEAATRSLERPYVPRHVPLPSSSYSAAAQSSVTTSTPNSSGSERDSIRAAEVHSTDKFRLQVDTAGSSRSPISQSRIASAAQPRHNQIQQADSHLPQNRHDDRAQRPELALSIASDSFTSTSRQHRCSVSQGLEGGEAQVVPPVKPVSSSTSKSEGSQTSSTFASAKRPHRREQAEANGLKAIKAAYPGLSESQATLLLRIFRQIKSLRSHAPSAVLVWYENVVWTTERESEGAQKIETVESLSLLLRYAYQRNDLRSLLRLECRAARMARPDKQTRSGIPRPASMSKELSSIEMDGVSIWPEPCENPRLLAYNLKIAFAAREGNWTQVDELLNDARLAKTSPAKAARSSACPARSVSILNAIGWGSLLRFGLGNVQKLRIGHSEIISTAVNTGSDPGSNSESVSAEEIEVEETKFRKAMDHEAQMQAKLSVSKRLLPELLRYTNAPNSYRTSHSQPQSDGAALEPKTPTWLLHSVLTQLAERGEAASMLRIVQLALSEEPSAVKPGAARNAESTHMLNLALTACVQNHSVNLAETLRIFNSLTGSQLGQCISGSAVLTRPTVVGKDQDELQGRSDALASRGGQDEKGKADRSVGGRVQGSRMMPNEESLVLVLKKVRHALFRASWTRRLVDEFEALFPQVKLSGRTFRMIIDKCVTPASHSSPRDAALESPPPATTERIVGSSRSRRRLRQASPEPPPSPAPTRRSPAIKQSLLLSTLDHIILRFATQPLHRSTTNRRRFEHTLLRASRALTAKRTLLPNHHNEPALRQIDTLLGRVAQVKRLGRAQDAQRKRRVGV